MKGFVPYKFIQQAIAFMKSPIAKHHLFAFAVAILHLTNPFITGRHAVGIGK